MAFIITVYYQIIVVMVIMSCHQPWFNLVAAFLFSKS